MKLEIQINLIEAQEKLAQYRMKSLGLIITSPRYEQ
jgi:hypothetical protein